MLLNQHLNFTGTRSCQTHRCQDPLGNKHYTQKGYGKGKPETFPLGNKHYTQKGYGKGKPETYPLGNKHYTQKGYGKGKPETFPLGNKHYTQKGYGKGKPETYPLGNKHYTQKGYGKGKPETFPLGNKHYTQKGYGKGKPETYPLGNKHYTQKGYGKGKPETFPLGNKHYTQKGYGKGKPETYPLGNKDLAIFFLEKDMRPGTTMKFQFPRNSNTATFLPRESTQSIPFSSNKLPEILNHFSVKPPSVEAKTIKQTIEECEAPGIKGEEIYCATSLESMVDFSTSKLRTRNVQAISTEVLEKGATMSIHKYTTMPGLKKLAGDNVVVCHKQNYPYAVFYCHAIKPTAAYVLSLKGDDGVKVKAVAICHLDTSEWNPKHLAFQILKIIETA
ncbi:PREDICTED: BURP domain-containing protein 5-like [Prunus mume]|uniref:BURP domain-containing protein 5-like n=1 Tax=Prunus mume TaxID=102107 RepID=A0ABM1LHU1_PRUMU|nr:PREDICTED: BURP domain-containing protein 5-like [Prunus mume]